MTTIGLSIESARLTTSPWSGRSVGEADRVGIIISTPQMSAHPSR
jgi:hypothetical protein